MSAVKVSAVEQAEVLGFRLAMRSKVARPAFAVLHHPSIGAMASGKGYNRKQALRRASEKAVAMYAQMMACLPPIAGGLLSQGKEG